LRPARSRSPMRVCRPMASMAQASIQLSKPIRAGFQSAGTIWAEFSAITATNPNANQGTDRSSPRRLREPPDACDQLVRGHSAMTSSRGPVRARAPSSRPPPHRPRHR
jgi:hypothetical protein